VQLGLGVRVVDYFYTAMHVWELLNPTFAIASLINGEVVAYTLKKEDLRVQRLGCDRVRFTSPGLVARCAQLQIKAAKLVPGRVNKDTWVPSFFKGKWHRASGAVVQDKELFSASHWPIRFSHTCTTFEGTSGSPIYQGTSIIGIHLGSYDKNFGVALCDQDPQWRTKHSPPAFPSTTPDAPKLKLEARYHGSKSYFSSSSHEDENDLIREGDFRKEDADDQDEAEREYYVKLHRADKLREEMEALENRTGGRFNEGDQQQFARWNQEYYDVIDWLDDFADDEEKSSKLRSRKAKVNEARTAVPDFETSREPEREDKKPEEKPEEEPPKKALPTFPSVVPSPAAPLPTPREESGEAISAPPPTSTPTRSKEVETKIDTSSPRETPSGPQGPTESTPSSTTSEQPKASAPAKKRKKRSAAAKLAASSQSSESTDGQPSVPTPKSDPSTSTSTAPGPGTHPWTNSVIDQQQRQINQLQAQLSELLKKQGSSTPAQRR